MRLNEIQARFAEMIITPGVSDEDFARIFAANNIPLQNRLGVYRNNVMGGLSNALTENFPLLEKLVGKDFLNAMAKAYVIANPPVSGCLTFYGDDFDQFVAGYAPAAHLPYLPDMARLEILINHASHARDDEALTPADLAEISSLEDAELKTRHAVHVMKSRWPLEKIRAFCLSEQDAPDINSGGVHLLIHRQHLDVEVVEITEGEYEFLSALQRKTLGEAVAHTMDISPDFDIKAALPRFVGLQLFLKDGKQ